MNSKAKIKGEKPEIRITVHVTFLLGENSGHYPVPNGAVRVTGHSIRIRDCPEKYGAVGNPTSVPSHIVPPCTVPIVNCTYQHQPPVILYLHAKFQLHT